MSLTSTAFIWTLRITLVVAAVWVVARWAEAAGPGLLNVVRRVVALALLIVLGVLNVFVPINAQWGWYTSWGDLISSFGPPTVVSASAVHGDSAKAAVDRDVGTDPLTSLPTAVRDSTHPSLTLTATGGYENVTVPGPISGYTGQITVWFPPSYTAPGNAHRLYPVLETFHGYLPSPLGYFSVFHLDSVIESLAQAHRMREAVVVLPHWAPNLVDTECVDGGPGRIRMEQWVAQDVPRWVYTHLRVASGRSSWASLGASAGGWCALLSTMHHPRLFGAAISLGGYARPDFDPSYVQFTPDSASGKRYDLIALARSAPPAVALWVLSSHPDKLSYPQTAALTATARSPLSVTPTLLATGGHRASVWTPYFPAALTWLGRVSAGFAPA